MHRKTIFEKVAEKFHTTPEEVCWKKQMLLTHGWIIL